MGNATTKGFKPTASCLWSDCAKPCTPKPVTSYIITLLCGKAKLKLGPPKILPKSGAHGAKRFEEYETFQEYGTAPRIQNAGQTMANA